MSLTPDSRVGPYRVVGPIGRGGMGEVFRATDTQLNRDVALKTLPEGFTQDPERLARFQREAQILASLNHPHIAAIYGFEQTDEGRVLVLEFVGGPTLADVIEKGPIPLDECLRLAVQMADALEVAHDKQIIHRDFKPANVKLTTDGDVKVLDFGIAKALINESTATEYLSPTITSGATKAGSVLGTAAYMSPEQARGRPLDRRTDIWAFGCVLYEMLTGRKPFGGEDVTQTLAAILKDEPDWSALPPGLPPRIEDLLRRCLHKDPRSRLRDIGDARIELTGAASDETRPMVAALPPRRSGWAVAVPLLVGLALGAGMVAALMPRQTPEDVTRAVVRASIVLPSEAPYSVFDYPGSCLALSPDASHLVYCGGDDGRRLYMRRLNDRAVAPIAGTEGGVNPFFSPDGRSVAFFTRGGQLKRIALAGGNAATLARDMPYSTFVNGTWLPDDRIVFDTWSAGLRVLGADGKAATSLTTPTNEWHQDPQALPGSTTVLFTVLTDTGQRIDALAVDSGTRTEVLGNASHARYLSSGHLLFVREGTIMAAPFDRGRLQVTGNAVPIPFEVAVDNPAAAAPLPQLAVSARGTLVYVPVGTSRPGTVIRVARDGAMTDVAPVAMISPNAQLSPDGSRLAIAGRDGGKVRIQLLDLAARSQSALSAHVQDFPSAMAWSPDGKQIYFATFGTNRGALHAQHVDRDQPRKLLDVVGTFIGVNGVSPDGRWLLYTVWKTTGNLDSDLWLADLSAADGQVRTRELIATAANEVGGPFSPNGEWMTWSSDESGRAEYYIRKFPSGESKRTISTGLMGANSRLAWAPDGRALYYSLDGGGMMGVGATFEPVPKLETPRLVFNTSPFVGEDFVLIGVTPGPEFMMVRRPRLVARTSELVVIPDWFVELRQLFDGAR